MTPRISEFEASRRRLRIFLANKLIALGWALKGYCKPCANRPFTRARWLVPEAQRFLVYRSSSHHRYRRILEFAGNLGTLFSRTQPRGVLAGFLIVVAFLALLDLALRATATRTQPLVENSVFQDETGTPSESKVSSVNKSSEPIQAFVSETGSISGAQIAPVPLPLRKPERVYKVPNEKGAKANAQKRMAQKKRARPKPLP